MILFVQPKIQVASKYERRVDTRSYDDKKKLFEGVSIAFVPIKSVADSSSSQATNGIQVSSTKRLVSFRTSRRDPDHPESIEKRSTEISIILRH